MPLVNNGRVIYNEAPTEHVIPGKTVIYDSTPTIDLESVPLNGGVLLKMLALSIDPYIRGKMDKSFSPEVRALLSPSWLFKPYLIGETLYNYGVAVVLRSENSAVKPGDHLYGVLTFEEYIIKMNVDDLVVIKNQEKLPWSVYTGAAGQTAVYGWKEFAHPVKGDIVFVSAGAGTVGSLVIQLAKLEGLKVIASAGSEEKVKFMKEIGADVAFNYKTSDIAEILNREGPINIYWDNVGGETLDAALVAAASRARFIECGMMTNYNNVSQPVQNLPMMIPKSIHLYGFIVLHMSEKYEADFYKTIPAMIAQGQLKYLENVTKGLDKVAEAILAMQMGINMGKCVVQVADD